MRQASWFFRKVVALTGMALAAGILSVVFSLSRTIQPSAADVLEQFMWATFLALWLGALPFLLVSAGSDLICAQLPHRRFVAWMVHTLGMALLSVTAVLIFPTPGASGWMAGGLALVLGSVFWATDERLRNSQGQSIKEVR